MGVSVEMAEAGQIPDSSGAIPARATLRFGPADQLETWPLARLIPFAKNARTHTEEQVAQIAASIREWGWTMPILVDEAGTIIAGHARARAASKLGWTEVPVLVARGWTEAQKRAYAIADNKLALNAGWDDALLALELKDLQALGADLGLVGFGERELSELLGAGEGLTDPDEVVPVPDHPVSTIGDCWLLGRHRLVCGDATKADDVRKCLKGVSPHLMVTDPPYGVEYDPTWRAAAGLNHNRKKLGAVTNDDRADWREAWALFPGDVAYVWHAGLEGAVVQESLRAAGFDLRSQIVWVKDRFALSRGHYHWSHEPLYYCVRRNQSAHWQGDRSQCTAWPIPSREDVGLGHGTQKPVECMRRPIENNSNTGDAVYDPFCGSGTSIIAAEMTGRVALTLEIDPAYVDAAIGRWERHVGEAARLEESGDTFADVRSQRAEANARPQA